MLLAAKTHIWTCFKQSAGQGRCARLVYLCWRLLATIGGELVWRPFAKYLAPAAQEGVILPSGTPGMGRSWSPSWSYGEAMPRVSGRGSHRKAAVFPFLPTVA